MNVDDLVKAGTTQEAIIKFKQQVTRTVEGELFLSVSLYVKDVQDKINQYLPAKGSKFNGAETPMENKIRLHKKGATQLRFKQLEIENKSGPCSATLVYRTERWLDRSSGLPIDRGRR